MGAILGAVVFGLRCYQLKIHQHRRLNPHRLGQLTNVQQAQIAPPSLNAAHITSTDTRCNGQLFLAPTQLFSYLNQILTKQCKDVVFHNQCLN